MSIETLLQRNPIIPVVTIADAADAVPLAAALAEGGISIVEVTLRSASALDAITAIATALPRIVVGAGTVRSGRDLAAAVGAGAQFAVAPGTTTPLIEAASASGVPFLPAAATASEVMTLLEVGFKLIKFFPAASLGGCAALSALAGPLPEARFCPSGGINATNFREYLALDNVVSVSGSWLAPSKLVTQRRWQEVARLAGHAISMLT